MKRHVVNKFCYILLLAVILSTFVACVDMKPWDYDNVVWYSETPEIEIVKTADVYWKGYIVFDEQKIEVELIWGPTGSFRIIDTEYLTSEGAIPADVITYLSGRVEYDSDSATLVISEDNLFGDKYDKIIMQRQDYVYI